MITGNDIKKLRIEHGLTQAQLARAIFVSESTIANYEAERRNVDFDKLKEIASVFGYDVELKLVKKIDTAKNESFYKEKSFNEIMNMNNEDLTDYIFISQNNETIARVCNIQLNILDTLEFGTIKDLLKGVIALINRDVIYFKLKGLYKGIEGETAMLIEDTNKYLEELSNTGKIDKDILEKVYYIDFDLYGDTDRGEMESDNMRLLDKDMNDLNVSHDLLMDGDYESDLYNPLFFNGQSYDLLYYVKHNPIIQLKY